MKSLIDGRERGISRTLTATLVFMMLMIVIIGPGFAQPFGARDQNFTFGWLILPALIVIVLMIVFAYVIPIPLFVRAWFSDAYVPVFTFVAMRLRRVNPMHVVTPLIMVRKAGIDVIEGEGVSARPLNLGVADLEEYYLAVGRDPRRLFNVVEALIEARRARIMVGGHLVDWKTVTDIDRSGRDVLDGVRTYVKPKVIECPDPASGQTMLDAVAKDGIRLLVRARVTVRVRLDRLVGGANEETIIARVGEGIVSAIGSANSYKDVLEVPDSISKTVLRKGLDAETAFQIVSIDIADVSVAGVSDRANVGAFLESERAETDMKIRRAEAEGKRAMAVAEEQQQRAKVVEMRSKVVEAEAEVPKAMAEAFRKGNLGIMDYYRMKNVIADTGMRDSISERSAPKDKTIQNPDETK